MPSIHSAGQRVKYDSIMFAYEYHRSGWWVPDEWKVGCNLGSGFSEHENLDVIRCQGGLWQWTEKHKRLTFKYQFLGLILSYSVQTLNPLKLSLWEYSESKGWGGVNFTDVMSEKGLQQSMTTETQHSYKEQGKSWTPVTREEGIWTLIG